MTNLKKNEIGKVPAPQRPTILLKKRLRHKCFPLIFAKFLRTPFLIKKPEGCFCKKQNKLPKMLQETSGFKPVIPLSRKLRN